MGDVGWKEVDKMVLFYKENREKERFLESN